MSKSRRLRPLAHLARDKEDKATARLTESRNRCQAQQQRLAELEEFEQEYRRRFEELGKVGTEGRRLQQYRQFMDQLSEAIGQQRHLVEECARELEQINREWSEQRSRRRALDKAIDRFEAQELRAANRRDQRECDDRPAYPRITADDADDP